MSCLFLEDQSHQAVTPHIARSICPFAFPEPSCLPSVHAVLICYGRETVTVTDVTDVTRCLGWVPFRSACILHGHRCIRRMHREALCDIKHVGLLFAMQDIPFSWLQSSVIHKLRPNRNPTNKRVHHWFSCPREGSSGKRSALQVKSDKIAGHDLWESKGSTGTTTYQNPP